MSAPQNPFTPNVKRWRDDTVEWDCTGLPDVTPSSGPQVVFDERDPSRHSKKPGPTPMTSDCRKVDDLDRHDSRKLAEL